MPSAFILINCDFRSTNEVMNDLKDIPEVVQIYPVDGVYDILSKINAANEDDLRKVVLRIRYFDSVISTLTMIISRENKATDSDIQHR